MCVTVPAFMFLWSQHDVVNHHFRRYTAPILRGVFGKSDENIFHTYFNFWLFFPIAFFRLLSKILPVRKKESNAMKQPPILGYLKVASSILFSIGFSNPRIYSFKIL